MANYLLDSNILIHIVRGTSLAEYVKQKYQPLLSDPLASISVVTEGELRSLALQWNWGAQKKEQVRYWVNHLVRIEVDSEDVFSAYANIDYYSEASGRSMGKNDLWIAAGAFVT